MAENESLDLGAAHSQRWDKLFSEIRKGASCGEAAAEVRKALYGGIKKARRQFQERGASLADFMVARTSRPHLRALVRKTEGHHYAQLLESAARASGPAPVDCLRGWVEAILDRVIDQICHRVVGTENWPTFFDIKVFTDEIRRALADDGGHIAAKLAEDPNCRLMPRRQKVTKPSPASPTDEMLGMSLLGGRKP